MNPEVKINLDNLDILENIMAKSDKQIITSEQIDDRVNHPKYYNNNSIGIECIEIARHFSFNLGNCIKYIYRHGNKEEQGISNELKKLEDLKKARFYIDDEIKMLEKKIEQSKISK